MKGLAIASTTAFAALVMAAVQGYLRPRRRRRHRPRAARAQTWLLQAGVRLSPVQFVASSATVAVAAFLLGAAITGVPALAVLPALGAGAAPWAWSARERDRRLSAIRDAWPDGLRHLVAAIGAGRSLSQAVATLATSGPEPLRQAFTDFPARARAVGFAAAAESIRDALADPATDRVVEVLVVAHAEGGRIVTEVLADLADALTSERRALADLRTQALEGKLNARAVFALPWIVLAALTASEGPFRAFYTTTAGAVVLGVGAALSLLGLGLVVWLGRLPEEPRVLHTTRERP